MSKKSSIKPAAAPAPQIEGDWGPTATQTVAPVAPVEAAPVVPSAPEDHADDGEGQPAETVATVAPEPEQADEYLVRKPGTFAEALEELKRIQALPENTGPLMRRKRHAERQIGQIVHAIQQGPPPPPVTLGELKADNQKNEAMREAGSLENFCRDNPVIAHVRTVQRNALATVEASALQSLVDAFALPATSEIEAVVRAEKISSAKSHFIGLAREDALRGLKLTALNARELVMLAEKHQTVRTLIAAVLR